MPRRTSGAAAQPPDDPLAERVRRKITEHGDEYPDPSDEQIRAVAALLPPCRPGRPRADDDDGAP
jgi:hypothetical protein